jgi:hypothetical protein
MLKCPREKVRSKELILAELSVNKCQKGRKAKSRWAISHSLRQGR